MNWYVVALASTSLFFLGVYAQASKFGAINLIDTGIGLVQIPIALADIVLLSLHIGWWTVAVFIATSFLAGMCAASLRRTGVDLLLLSKSWTGPLTLLTLIAGAVVHITS
ncbi:hypothetical protein NFI99_26265 [Burkholderia glumae]|uniref:Uncharacterized protein n=1 Tax=Burkholderia glumae TaxID=337 RepID=A0ABY5BDU6_BURGL|nr:hypothetical protein [Burkholderia glumae]USS45097.1 hypothetical protein NFI99_26265 [Burkholderia glumae]